MPAKIARTRRFDRRRTVSNIEAMLRFARPGPFSRTALAMSALVCTGLFMAAVGAFDTDRTPAGLRTIYWLVVMVGSGLPAWALDERLLLHPALRRRQALRVAVHVLAITPATTALVFLISALLFGASFSPGRFLTLLPAVALVDVAMLGLFALLRRPTHAPSAKIGAMPLGLSRLLSPKIARARLLAVEAEDHYIRVHTDCGHELVLMTFAETLDLLRNADGFRVHRSWWVARSAVETARWRRGRGEVTLANGACVPVSATYAPVIKDQRWV